MIWVSCPSSCLWMVCSFCSAGPSSSLIILSASCSTRPDDSISSTGSNTNVMCALNVCADISGRAVSVIVVKCICMCILQTGDDTRKRHTDRRTDGRTDRQAGRQADRQAGRQTEKRTDAQTGWWHKLLHHPLMPPSIAEQYFRAEISEILTPEPPCYDAQMMP